MTEHWITLTDAEVGEAGMYAWKRHDAALALGRKDNNNLVVDAQKSFEMHRLGCRAERAGKKFLDPIQWNAFADKLDNLPDLQIGAVMIDIKGIDRHSLNLIVPRGHGKRSWCYVLISAADHPRYCLFGWMPGAQLAEYPVTEPNKGRPARVVPKKDLLDMAALLERVELEREK